MTVAQQYIKDHGPAPKELREDDDAGMMPVVDALVHWSGKGNLASYRALEPKLTQKYRLYGEKCVVIGCKRTVDAPKYIMELVGAPMCTQCAQKLALQQLKGSGPDPYKPEFEKPTAEDIEKAKAAGVSLPGWD